MAKKTTVKTANLPQHVRAEQKTESACVRGRPILLV